MLETTLAAKFVPGSNLRGGEPLADWRFLLPSVTIERAICVGTPERAAAAGVQQVARAVDYVRPGVDAGPLRRADALLVLGVTEARGVARDPRLAASLGQALKPSGAVYVDADPLAALSKGELTTLELNLGPLERLWLASAREKACAAAPLGDSAAIEYLVRHGLDAPTERRGPARIQRHAAGRAPALARLARRRRAALGGPERAAAPPRYLRALAADAGVPLDRHRWALSAPGQYRSRKVVFLLFPPGGDVPDYVVKMTRDSAFNARLENERRALERLGELRLPHPAAVPRPVFAGHADDLAVLGETHVAGVAARPRELLADDLAGARRGLDWLAQLAATSADHSVTGAGAAAAVLRELLKRFREIYAPPAGYAEFLSREIDALGAIAEPFPAVFQHGDPGAWNMLLTPGGEVAFLDWEAAEPRGMPLWDLFHFAHSCGLWRRERDDARGWRPKLAAALQESVRRLSCEIELPTAAVRPLFYTCWMHRALKEATRLPPDALGDGWYVRVLRRLIHEDDPLGAGRAR